MATTLKQTLANRLNALRSTGPKSTEGKARSSRNAQTHGLSRVGLHPPADMAEAIAQRQSLWRTDYHPTGSAQEWHFDRLVAESVRLDCCEARICASRAERATRASESWDDDQAAAIAQRAATLSQRPEIIQPVLLQSRHGVLWLLERWDEVRESLQRLDGWTPETWNLALDLLGVPPSARDASGPWDLHPEDNSAAPGLDLVAQSTSALRDRLDTFLNARDDRARIDACLGLDADDPPALPIRNPHTLRRSPGRSSHPSSRPIRPPAEHLDARELPDARRVRPLPTLAPACGGEVQRRARPTGVRQIPTLAPACGGEGGRRPGEGVRRPRLPREHRRDPGPVHKPGSRHRTDGPFDPAPRRLARLDAPRSPRRPRSFAQQPPLPTRPSRLGPTLLT